MDNDDVLKLQTGYRPKIEVLKDVKLPLELRNRRGVVMASITYQDGKNKGYHGYVLSLIHI